jgi:hypothetical protein
LPQHRRRDQLVGREMAGPRGRRVLILISVVFCTGAVTSYMQRSSGYNRRAGSWQGCRARCPSLDVRPGSVTRARVVRGVARPVRSCPSRGVSSWVATPVRIRRVW